MNITRCDRCRADVVKATPGIGNSPPRRERDRVIVFNTDLKLDLCEKCMAILVAWVDEYRDPAP